MEAQQARRETVKKAKTTTKKSLPPKFSAKFDDGDADAIIVWTSKDGSPLDAAPPNG